MNVVGRLDTQTWLILGGVVLVLVLVTRRSSRS
jgi:hypothetical protein